MSIALTQKSAIALANNVADVLVVAPFSFVAVPSHVTNQLKLRIIDRESELDISGYVEHGCAVKPFRDRCKERIAELVKDLRTKALLKRTIEKLAS